MKLGKTSKGLISVLCMWVLLFTATPVWADTNNTNVETGSGAKAGGNGGESNVAVGSGAKAGTGANSSKNVAVGADAQAGNGDNQSNNTAVGYGATASGTNATAIGMNASATADNSVAIGAGSVTGNRSNTVSVGAPGAERQITNVADGVAATDAVNVRQLKHAESRIDKVGALAAAMSGLAPLSYVENQRTQASFAAGMYSGEKAVAAGIYHYTSEDVLLNAAYAICGSEDMGRVGVSFRLGKHKAPAPTPAPVEPATPAEPATPPQVQEPGPVVVVDEPSDPVRRG